MFLLCLLSKMSFRFGAIFFYSTINSDLLSSFDAAFPMAAPAKMGMSGKGMVGTSINETFTQKNGARVPILPLGRMHAVQDRSP